MAFFVKKKTLYLHILIFVSMTEQEVYNELLTKVKPYIGIMPQSSFSRSMIHFRVGLLKPATTRLFFTRLGYELNPVTNVWHKK